MNLIESIAPKSDQLNADDLIAGPRLVTILEVRKGTAEQPVSVVTEEFGPGRPYKPSKSMRRVLVTAWGPDGASYAGHQLVIFRNPKIRFGGDEVGGIQISHMSHIDGPLMIALTVTRGRRAPFTVQPLNAPEKQKDESGRDWLLELADLAGDVDRIKELGGEARAAHAADAVIAVILTEYRRAIEDAADDSTPAPEAVQR
jgi:hypothetical protein